VVKTVREIPREIVLLTVISTVAWTAFMIVCRTISQTVFRIALHAILPIISKAAWGMG